MNKDIKENKEHDIPIILDRKQYKVPSGTITGSHIRALPNPPIGPELDLWQEVPGKDDIKIGNDDAVSIKPGMHFYSAPGTINPGAA